MYESNLLSNLSLNVKFKHEEKLNSNIFKSWVTKLINLKIQGPKPNLSEGVEFKTHFFSNNLTTYLQNIVSQHF